MEANEPYLRVVLLIPEPFRDSWTKLIKLSQAVTEREHLVADVVDWPILALTIKAAHTTLSVATLAAMRQWPDAWILGRSLFETEIFVKWLLEADTQHRLATYLAEIDTEMTRLDHKMLQGRSVAAQVLKDILPPEVLRNDAPVTPRDRQLGTVRARAQRTNLDRSYDIPYWIASVFAHSHALSLSQWNPALAAAQSHFKDIFSFRDKGLPSWMVLEAIPMNALDTFELANHHFGLDLQGLISDTRQAFRDVVTKVSGGRVQFTTAIERGEVRIEYEDGSVKTYTPVKTGRDPLDDL